MTKVMACKHSPQGQHRLMTVPSYASEDIYRNLLEISGFLCETSNQGTRDTEPDSHYERLGRERYRIRGIPNKPVITQTLRVLLPPLEFFGQQLNRLITMPSYLYSDIYVQIYCLATVSVSSCHFSHHDPQNVRSQNQIQLIVQGCLGYQPLKEVRSQNTVNKIR